MGWFSVLIGLSACILLYLVENWLAFWIALVVTIGVFWTYGVIHNYATESAKWHAANKGEEHTGGFYDFENHDLDAIPDWLAQVNMALSIIALGFLVYGIYAKLSS